MQQTCNTVATDHTQWCMAAIIHMLIKVHVPTHIFAKSTTVTQKQLKENIK